MNSIEYKTKFNKYLSSSKSHYCIISCSEKCQDHKCINNKCDVGNVKFLNDIEAVNDFDIIKELFCKCNNVYCIGSCDGIVFLNTGKVLLIEFNLACESIKSMEKNRTQLREKLFSSIDIICNICGIHNRLDFSKNNVVYYIVYNEEIFDVDKFLKNFSSNGEYEFDYESGFFGSIIQKANLFCKYLSLDYFKKFVVSDVKVLSKEEFVKDKKTWKLL